MVIRILRLLRVFRILKLTHMVKQATILRRPLIASRGKIPVFLFAVLTLVVVVGSEKGGGDGLIQVIHGIKLYEKSFTFIYFYFKA